MGIGETIDCPICGKHDCMDMDGLYECMNCGTHETVQCNGAYPEGRIWTHIPHPIGLVRIKKEKK